VPGHGSEKIVGKNSKERFAVGSIVNIQNWTRETVMMKQKTIDEGLDEQMRLRIQKFVEDTRGRRERGELVMVPEPPPVASVVSKKKLRAIKRSYQPVATQTDIRKLQAHDLD
jgi:hypothetical protein